MRIDIFVSDSIKLTGRKLARPVEVRPLAELQSQQGQPKPAVIVGTARELSAIHPKYVEELREEGVRVIVTEAVPGTPMPRFKKDLIHASLPSLDKRDEWRILQALLNNAIELLILQNKERRTQKYLEELTHIGVLLSSEKDTNKLLKLILTKSREITHCDAGSLYMVDDVNGEKRLLFKMAQNDSVPLDLKEFPMPLNDRSLAGYVVLSGQPLLIDNAYEIDLSKPYSHARWVDKKNNYRTITILTVPLKNLKGEVLGGLQLINRKRDPRVRLIDPLTAMVVVQPFDDHAIDLVTSLASLAAVTLEKNMLYEEIQSLFEGFVKASVKAIESRDPTTSGHSERVAKLTVGLAEKVDGIATGPLSGVRFAPEELRELRYASLLHDFGKVGVREHVLVKAKKFYPREEDVLRIRAAFIRAAMTSDSWRKRLDRILEKGVEAFRREEPQFDAELMKMLGELDADLKLIWEANEPRVLPEGSYDRLVGISERVYSSFDQQPLHLLSKEEVGVLSIPRGSLTEEERLEIESHVTHTYHFLREIPWTKELKRVPEVAYKHHEKLNQVGYPRRLSASDIPLQSRMMTICDIFDALTASDRPYKKAVPVDKALDILHQEMKAGQLDPLLLQVFIEAKLFGLTTEGR